MARYLIARRVADQEPARARTKRTSLHTLRKQVASFASVIDTGGETEADESAETIVLEGDSSEVEAKRKELPENFIIETEKFRRPGVFHPIVSSIRSPEEFTIGLGATAEINVSCAGRPLPAAQIVMTSIAFRGGFLSTSFGNTDENGRALLPFNPTVWMPFGVTILPRARAWSIFTRIFGRRLNVALPALPRNGPLAWWHRMMGLNKFSENLGEGIRVGVIDTGVGPHPYLSHIRNAGAFQNGQRLRTLGSSNDVSDHGTHVAGLIGARPPSGSRDFAGIAPGVDLVAARIYQGGGPPTQEAGTTTNGDVAQAILTLARDEECDLINLSSGGPMRSIIEADRINAALNRGTLVICSVGNGGGPPILYPAADPNAVAVSALGLTGGLPFGVLDNVSYPMQPDRYSAAGFFAPAFISIGPETKCTGAGVGIVSTVPSTPTDEAPYVAMSGTSMAAPAVTGALAAILSQDSTYRSLPRTRERSSYALRVLGKAIRTLGLNFQYQGFGMPVIQG